MARLSTVALVALALTSPALANENTNVTAGGTVAAAASPAVATTAGAVGAASAATGAELASELQMRAAFDGWKKQDGGARIAAAIAIPSIKPVDQLSFSSNFGIRSDPFQGTARMHAGIDIRGATGTPVYATADGVITNAGRLGGYGNMVEVNHGKGIATRYGHLSKILVADNTRVTRGQLIGLIGSTGRSTGPHLHYEVRIDGHAVNPVPFLQSANYLDALQDRSLHVIPVAAPGAAPSDDSTD